MSKSHFVKALYELQVCDADLCEESRIAFYKYFEGALVAHVHVLVSLRTRNSQLIKAKVTCFLFYFVVS